MKLNKFKSGISPLIHIFMLIYHISIMVLFFLPLILYKDITTRLAIMLLIFNVLFLYPVVYNTYYSLEEKELFIFQWPFTKLKIRYCDIFEITDALPEGIKKVKKLSLSKPKFYVGYYVNKFNKETKKEERIKAYVEISPKDIDMFMIKMGGHFKIARDLAAKLEEEHQQKDAEHQRKKKIADKKREELEEANKPVDVVVSPVKKNKAKVKVEETEE